MAQNKIKSATDQRSFTLVYDDFLESDLLDYYEKIIFIYLKKYADNETLKAFPSLSRLHKDTGISRSYIQKCINKMAEKGVIKVEKRDSKDYGHQSNLYTLYDYAEIWNVDSSSTDIETVAEEVSTAKMIAELKKKGYTVTKEKRPDTQTDQSRVTSPETNSQLNIVKTTNNYKEDTEISQVEKYSMTDIHELYDYDIMIQSNRHSAVDIDTVMNILYDVLNSRKDTIRVQREEKPRNVVVSRLMKLWYEDIFYVLDKYKEQTKRIKYPESYILTQLYKAKEQSHLDISNEVQHDLYGNED